jgi:hypothetical protein|tara:strand:- start:165 stop:266 length:102 start_codon:yes stop_codon:yes gene_type:complete
MFIEMIDSAIRHFEFRINPKQKATDLQVDGSIL